MVQIATPSPTTSVKPVAGLHLPTASKTTTTKITKVEDGDTVQVTDERGTVSLRLAGVDAPELAYGNQPSQCYALEASTKLKSELLGKTVMVERDPSQPDTDGVGRLIRYISIDGADYGEKVVAEGYGHQYNFHSAPHALATRYQAAQDAAEKAGKGFWSKTTCAGNTQKPGFFQQPIVFQAVKPSSIPPTCQSFKTTEDAQRFYEANGGPFEDRYKLDPQRNGRACSELP